jgi:hypothetical protein
MKPISVLIKPEMFPYCIILTACFCLLFGVFVLSPPEAESGQIALGHFALPGVCIFKNLTGLPCPGCGLTRSMTAAVRGNLSQSWMFHRLGFVTTFYILIQFLLNLMILTVSPWRERLQKIGRYLNNGLVFLGILFVLNWVVNLVSML